MDSLSEYGEKYRRILTYFLKKREYTRISLPTLTTLILRWLARTIIIVEDNTIMIYSINLLGIMRGLLDFSGGFSLLRKLNIQKPLRDMMVHVKNQIYTIDMTIGLVCWGNGKTSYIKENTKK